VKKLYVKSDYKRVKELESDYRSPFRRDYSRIIHSPAFRRLQGKTQLFPGFESDFFRNRLTHSLEVAQISKSIALKINSEHAYFMENNIDYDLIEFAGLAHDLGHPPFGHNGEQALNKCMVKYGGFEGNAQTLRILSRIDKKELLNDNSSEIFMNGEDQRIGLNLSMRTLASILKYDFKIPEKNKKVTKGYYYQDAKLVENIKKACCDNSIIDDTFKTIECSIMDLADDISYSTYDLSKKLSENGYFRILYTSRLVNEFISGIKIELNEKNPSLSKASFDDKTRNKVEVLKKYTYIKIINSSMLKVSEHRGEKIIEEIFSAIDGNTNLLPEDFQCIYHESPSESDKKRVICDFIAGMTDRYVIEFYGRLFSESPETIFKPL